MNNLENLIKTSIKLGATEAMVELGVTSGEKSWRQMRQTYGKQFVDADKEGRIHPCRIENGKAGTKWYSVADFLSLRVLDYARAELTY